MIIQPGLKRWLSIGVILLLAAGTTIAGIQGTGIRALAAFGTIDTGAGLQLNGVPYDTSHAHVVVNGLPGNVSELHTGHIVSAQGSLSTDGPVADEIVLESDVRGEVTSVDEARGVFSVLGQTIRLTDQTVLDAQIQSGMWVQVSAFERADGTYEASRVDLDLVPGTSQIRGVVSSVDSDQQTLRVGGLTVNYSAAMTQGVIAEGEIVLARGLQVQVGETLYASQLQVFGGIGHPGAQGDVKGVVTRFASAADFDVNGQPVATDENTVYALHGQSLGTDLEVRVTGSFDATGVLVAHKIRADAPQNAKGARGKGPK